MVHPATGGLVVFLLTAALERLTTIGIKPIANPPVLLPEALVPGTPDLTFVRDPDGNFVELISPRK